MSAVFKGSIVALITPMKVSGEIDFEVYRNLLRWHVASGTHGLVISGTTGESATLSSAEKVELWQVAVEEVAGRIPVIAGTGTSATATTISETRAAASCGVNACLVVTPYYNRPTQQGLYEHYKAVAENSDVPIFAYNVPRRTGCDLQPATLARLAFVENIIGIKEATGDVLRVAAYKALVADRFILLSGDDATALEFMQAGGSGVISVTANVLPVLMARFCDLALVGNEQAAKALADKMHDVHLALMCESNPIPTKWALASLGKIAAGIRLPLTELNESYHTMVRDAIQELVKEDAELLPQLIGVKS